MERQNALMSADPIVSRGNIFPLVEYESGRTGFGAPNFLYQPFAAANRLLYERPYQPGTQDVEGVRDAADAAGAASAGSFFFRRPLNSLGAGGRPTRWTGEQLEALLKDRSDGLTYRQLGEKYGIDHGRVGKVLKNNEAAGRLTPEAYLDDLIQPEQLGRAVQQSMREGYDNALLQRDYTRRLIEAGHTNAEAAAKLTDRFGREITPDKVRQSNTWGGLNERYVSDRYGRPTSIIKDAAE